MVPNVASAATTAVLIAGRLALLRVERMLVGRLCHARVRVVLAYALICHRRGRHGAELAALLHRRENVAELQQRLLHLIRDLLAEVAATGGLRVDVPPEELASFCMHALTAAADLPSEAAVRRLVTVTLAGLRPPH